MPEPIKINWYRCKLDQSLLSQLMRKSDARGFAQTITQLLIFVLTGTLAYIIFRQLRIENLPWMLPLLLLSLFFHGTNASFFRIAVHELGHRTPFATQFWNTFFLIVFSFLSWFNYTGFRASHIRHHQATTHTDHDGEVILPQGLDWHGIKFATSLIVFSPADVLKQLRFWLTAAIGDLSYDGYFKANWLQRVIPESDAKLRSEIRNWAHILLLGHLTLAAVFIVTGHWFLIILVNFGSFYSGWFAHLCSKPQHVGLSPNTPDFRLCCRSYTCGWFPAFFYWNMQYHVEHHMFPSVPFYNLPRLRAALLHDLPPAKHGLWATWREILAILKRQRKDPNYVFIPLLPSNDGVRIDHETIRREAANTVGPK